MAKKRSQALEPLRRFDYGLIGPKLEGLFVNIDRDLQRRAAELQLPKDMDSERCLVLLDMMFRFSWNAYKAVLYIGGQTPEDPLRKPSYALVIPNICRQLLDILFSLAYMLDDFSVRSLRYQRAGWKELLEEYRQFNQHFGENEQWKPHLKQLKKITASMAARYNITLHEQRNPKLVQYWPTPFQLSQEKTACADFLKYLEMWLYRDTSTQTHLGHAGMIKVAHHLIADLVGDAATPELQDRANKMYHFTWVSRSAMAFLAIATEIDAYCHLGNHSQIDYIWVMLGVHAPEAKELYEIRYQNRNR